jgi:hypothetical protein
MVMDVVHWQQWPPSCMVTAMALTAVAGVTADATAEGNVFDEGNGGGDCGGEGNGGGNGYDEGSGRRQRGRQRRWQPWQQQRQEG